jgi:CheY-like chemotaxis protein
MKPPSILIVEDDGLIRETLGRLFSEIASVHMTSTNEEAFDVLDNHLPDLIISDIHHPGKNGLEFLDTIRHAPRTRHIPFIVLTGGDTLEMRRRAFMLGCDEFIAKPESATYLRLRVSRILERAASVHVDLETPKVTEPLRIFICYAKEDAKHARKIWSFANLNGVNAWLDEKKLLPGHEWEMEIRRAIRTSHLVVVCLSQCSITKSGYVQKEIRMVLDIADEQPPGTNFIVPIRIEPCAVPERLAQWQWLDFFGRNANKKLLGALAARADALRVLPPASAFRPKA